MTGFVEFHERLKDIESKTGCRPDIVMEATGHYHLPLVRFLEERGYLVIVLNPLISQRAKKTVKV